MNISTTATVPTRLVRQILTLTHEAHEIKSEDNPLRHLLNGVCKLSGADVGAMFVFASPIACVPHAGLVCGYSPSQTQSVLAEYATQSVDFDLMAAKLRAGFSGSGQLLVRRRQELIDSRGWYNSSFVNDTRRRWGVDHCLYSLQHLGTSILGMGINRSFGSRPFSSRDQALIEIFHLAIAHVARFATTSTKASQNEARRNALSPRTRDTLDCLLRGASTKHIADELQLSPHTVHHYCKDIFRTFGVKSRSELVANWFTGHR